MSSKNQFYTLQEVIKDKENPILNVLNTSKPKGNITFEVADGMGGKTSILIPTTWVPIDITTQAPKEAILNNAQFRKLIAAGLLSIPSDSYIKSLENKEGYEKERLKTYSALAAAEEGFNSDINSSLNKVEEGQNVSGFVLNLVNSTDIDESEAMNSVRLQEDSLTKEELTYLVNNCKFAKVKSLAAEILQSKQE